MIRVGRRTYSSGTQFTDPTFPGFTPIVVLMKSSAYGSLGPYELYDEYGRNMENVWQFSKVYESVPYSKQTYSRFDNTVIWEYPAETHARQEEVHPDGSVRWTLLPAYFNWRNKGMNAKYAIRYPVGINHRHKCLFALAEGDLATPLDYVESRKAIYSPLYQRLVRSRSQFKELQQRHQRGENLLIIEVDGPHEESLPYYKTKYGVTDEFIQNSTMLATPENLQIMLNDSKHPYGHGYCLAEALMNSSP